MVCLLIQEVFFLFQDMNISGEYLCDLFGDEIENGELPNDMNWVGKVIQDICFNNAKNYFNWQLERANLTEKKSERYNNRNIIKQNIKRLKLKSPASSDFNV